MQKGDAPEALAAAKKELEIKRAGSASKGAKVFYKVTVKVRLLTKPCKSLSGLQQCHWQGLHCHYTCSGIEVCHHVTVKVSLSPYLVWQGRLTDCVIREILLLDPLWIFYYSISNAASLWWYGFGRSTSVS